MAHGTLFAQRSRDRIGLVLDGCNGRGSISYGEMNQLRMRDLPLPARSSLYRRSLVLGSDMNKVYGLLMLRRQHSNDIARFIEPSQHTNFMQFYYCKVYAESSEMTHNEWIQWLRRWTIAYLHMDFFWRPDKLKKKKKQDKMWPL